MVAKKMAWTCLCRQLELSSFILSFLMNRLDEVLLHRGLSEKERKGDKAVGKVENARNRVIPLLCLLGSNSQTLHIA